MSDLQDDFEDEDIKPPSTLPTTENTASTSGQGRTLGGAPVASTGSSTPEPRTSSGAGKAKRTGG